MKAQTLREMIRQHEYYHAGTSKGLDNIELEAAIKAWAKELVGEDEEIENPDNFTDHDFYAAAQNDLRAELRELIDAA